MALNPHRKGLEGGNDADCDPEPLVGQAGSELGRALSPLVGRVKLRQAVLDTHGHVELVLFEALLGALMNKGAQEDLVDLPAEAGVVPATPGLAKRGAKSRQGAS